MANFDALATARDLEGAGMERRQAEAVAAACREAAGADRGELVTKADLAPLATKAELAAAIAPLATKAELAAAIAPLATKAELAAAIAPLATKAELAAAIAPLATKAELAALETRLTWRMVGVVAGVNGAFAALIVGLLVAVLDRLP